MRSDHFRSTDRGIRQVYCLRQTSEATAEADAEPQRQIGDDRSRKTRAVRAMPLTHQSVSELHARSRAEEPRPESGGAVRSQLQHFHWTGPRWLQPAPSRSWWQWAPSHRSKLPQPVAKIETLQLCKWTECGGAGSSCPRRPRQHGYHRLWLLQLVLSEATGHSQVKGRRAVHSPGRHPRHQLGGDCCVHGMSHPPVPHAQYCMNLVNPTIFPMTYSF